MLSRLTLFAGPNTVTVNGTSANDVVGVVRNAVNDTVQVNTLLTVTVVSADTQSLVAATGNGIVTVTSPAAADRP